MERYFSRASRAVRDAFQVINYVLANPARADIQPRRGVDAFVWANVELL